MTLKCAQFILSHAGGIIYAEESSALRVQQCQFSRGRVFADPDAQNQRVQLNLCAHITNMISCLQACGGAIYGRRGATLSIAQSHFTDMMAVGVPLLEDQISEDQRHGRGGAICTWGADEASVSH